MRTKFFVWLAAGIGAGLLSGCVSNVDGRYSSGVPFMKDRVEGRYESKPVALWEAAKDVLKYNGTLYTENPDQAILQANVDTRTVWVKIEEVDDKVSRLIVQCRTKGGMPDVELAGFLDKQIAVRLATGNLTPATPGRRAY